MRNGYELFAVSLLPELLAVLVAAEAWVATGEAAAVATEAAAIATESSRPTWTAEATARDHWHPTEATLVATEASWTAAEASHAARSTVAASHATEVSRATEAATAATGSAKSATEAATATAEATGSTKTAAEPASHATASATEAAVVAATLAHVAVAEEGREVELLADSVAGVPEDVMDLLALLLPRDLLIVLDRLKAKMFPFLLRVHSPIMCGVPVGAVGWPSRAPCRSPFFTGRKSTRQWVYVRC